jgi:ribosomal protein S13
MTNSSNNSDANKTDLKQVTRPETSTAKTPAIQKCRKNALTHGIYAEEFVLEWESEDDLIMLRNGLWAELHPEGRFEEETALGIVNLLWQKRRVMRTAQLGFRRDPFAIEAGRSNPKSVDDLVQLMTLASGDERKLSQAAKESLDTLKEATEKIKEINMACLHGHSQAGTPKEAFKAAQEAKEGVDFVEKILSEQVFPRMIKLEEASKSGVATVYEKAYSHEHLEKTLRIEAALDARLDKQMARFVNLKEYKRIRKETSNPVLEAVPIAAA